MNKYLNIKELTEKFSSNEIIIKIKQDNKSILSNNFNINIDNASYGEKTISICLFLKTYIEAINRRKLKAFLSNEQIAYICNCSSSLVKNVLANKLREVLKRTRNINRKKNKKAFVHIFHFLKSDFNVFNLNLRHLKCFFKRHPEHLNKNFEDNNSLKGIIKPEIANKYLDEDEQEEDRNILHMVDIKI